MGKKYKGFKGSGMQNKITKKELNELVIKAYQECIINPLLKMKMGYKDTIKEAININNKDDKYE